MNILYIYRSLAIVGGVERIFTDKANYLAEQLGHTVYIATYEQCGRPITYPLSSKVTHVDLNGLFYEKYRHGLLKRLQIQAQMNELFFTRLKELVERTKIDMIICTSNELPVVKAVIRQKKSVKKIIETHEAKSHMGRANQEKVNILIKLAFKLKCRKLYKYIKKADVFVALTSKDAKEWSPITNAHVIPNILTYYPPQIDLAKKRGKRVISAGRLTKQKGYDLLVPAWEIVHRTHPDWQLDIYGDGEDKEMIEQEIEQRGLLGVITIHNPTRQIYEKYQESDFYVMSSRWEGFGLVLSEAMSCGIPCISFDCPHGPSDIICDGEDGFLVENGNIAQLAEKICHLIEHEKIRQEMGCKARENVKRYLPENIMPQWEKLFNDLTTTL